jgi:HlyD family type I secretion membrane fusion protein
MASISHGYERDLGIPKSTMGWTIFGTCFIGLTIVAFGIWGNMAQIAGAVVSPGVFVATGENKTVQHLEGGVIRNILVHEGDVVEPKQVLIELDDTVAKAELRRLTLREDRLVAVEARLVVEAQLGDSLKFPDRLADSNDPDVVAILEDQRQEFAARSQKLQSELDVLNDEIEALNQRIDGSQVQKKAVDKQLNLLAQETSAKQTLLANGLIRLSEVLALQRAAANGEGEIGRLVGDIGTSREQISRTRAQMIAARDAAVKTAVDELQTTRADLNDVRERIHAATDVLNRTKITAPVKGVVVKLRYHTTGGVIEAGREIMQIVPLQDELLIEAHVRPQDIEFVKRGAAATIRLTALNQRITPMVQGTVIYVSADALPEDRRGVPTTSDLYVARVRLNEEDAAKIQGFSPVPGMPAEVYIKTAERTFFQYLTRPIKDSMSRAFREP